MLAHEVRVAREELAAAEEQMLRAAGCAITLDQLRLPDAPEALRTGQHRCPNCGAEFR